MENKELEATIYKDLKKDYDGVEKIVMENEAEFFVYADDDTLWKIFEDMNNEFKSIEFDAGVGETHFLKIVI
jgi:hypothetical protein